MPVIGPQMSGNLGSLTGSGVALAIAIVASLWTGLGATLSVGDALDRLWAVPRVDRSGFVQARARGLLVLDTLGTLTVVSTAAVGLGGQCSDTAAPGGRGERRRGIGIDLLIFVACFRLLTSAAITTRAVLPGAAVAAIGWCALQAIEGILRGPRCEGQHRAYGTFAAVIGLLSWLYLGHS